jgi:hypothetical protein
MSQGAQTMGCYVAGGVRLGRPRRRVAGRSVAGGLGAAARENQKVRRVIIFDYCRRTAITEVWLRGVVAIPSTAAIRHRKIFDMEWSISALSPQGSNLLCRFLR